MESDEDCVKREILLEKARRRQQLREHFLKMKTNPFKHLLGEGGTVMDPAIMRYQAMQISGYDSFRPSWKTGTSAILWFVAPFCLYWYAVHTSKHNEEEKIRRGEVAYKDRRAKFV
uniref:NADH dehydrogenase [ubiquinone] 1 beta subcomplex subunit 4 n=1 Tax=Diabrotica virgifera virgifera TaxID=50390 RepID=A0A6P7F7D8_DIAVI